MMKMKLNLLKPTFIFLLISGLAVFIGCNDEKQSRLSDLEILHQNQDQLTQVIIYDIFTPPVASRIYAYTSLASYEAIRFSKEGTVSIAEKLNGFDKMPQPEQGKKYNFTLSASRAFFEVAKNIKVFSVDSFKVYEENLYLSFKNELDELEYNNSMAFGDSVAKKILARAKTDGYFESRGKPKFLGNSEPGQWRPTPPDYLDGIEWCWNTMKTFVLDSASQFMPAPPPKYDMDDTTSQFCQGVLETYRINKSLTDEQIEIAKYWDDNPAVIEHSGHMTFANKKITPGGHWMGITALASKQAGADLVKTAQSYALTAIALYEGFISCWDEKYRSNYVRPVTVINEKIEKTWMPLLQTPPFPEYTSGHSTISASAAEVLTALYGDNFAFLDTSDLPYIGMQRNFTSFRQAALESSISRVYGGIHYRFSTDTGTEQGKKIGALIVKKLLE
jgi:hypothetical protein